MGEESEHGVARYFGCTTLRLLAVLFAHREPPWNFPAEGDLASALMIHMYIIMPKKFQVMVLFRQI